MLSGDSFVSEEDFYSMRRIHAHWFAILFAVLCLTMGITCSGKADGRKLTLMVYLCGSNLENDYGAASSDITEMIGAKADRNVTVLLMAGGSKSWRLGYEKDKCTLVEVSARGQRKVYETEAMNMGEAETLTLLLDYGREKYPAEDYALILWDHGGGPVEGVCWDELYSMDHLSLGELTAGLDAAHLEKKLKWIGFDACLMGSLEVASALEPYADYMIASQETEPAFGWNYSFLNGIEEDETGADTGRRIVDAYFDGQEAYQDIMTLSCLDLSRTDDARKKMDDFFSESDWVMTSEAFQELSGVRSSVTGFGRAVRAEGEDGFDLVDARGLFESLGDGLPAGSQLAEALEALVVYSRSNEEGAAGVSLYHPYANKKKYAEKWRDEYEKLHFSEGYTHYIQAFGSVLLGGAITDWNGLQTASAGADGSGNEQFTLRLTPEQAEGFTSAQLLILSDQLTESELRDHCMLTYTGKTELAADGTVTGTYTGRNLYIELEDGTLYGPAAFNRTPDGQFIYFRMVYIPEGISDTEQFTHVLYYLDPQGEEEYPEVLRTRVWDRATETFTNRIFFDESMYTGIHLAEIGKKLPKTDERGLMPAYENWEDSDILIGGLDIPLPNHWRFRWIDEQLSGKQLYAVFQVTDAQQNVFCVPPASVTNPAQQTFSGIPMKEGNESFRFGLDATLVFSRMEKEVRFLISVQNHTGRAATYTFSELTVNGKRISRDYPVQMNSAGSPETEIQLFTMDAAEFFGIERIESAEMTVRVKDGQETEEIPVLVRFEGFEVTDLWKNLTPLAETRQEEATFRLLSLEPYMGTGIKAWVLAENDREETIQPESDAVIGGIQLGGSIQPEIPAGRSRVLLWKLKNSLSIAGYELETIDENRYFYLTQLSDHLLQHQEVTEISGIMFYIRAGRKGSYQEPVMLQMKESVPLTDTNLSTYLNTSMTISDPEEKADDPLGRLEIAENNQYTAACRKILVGRFGAAVQIELINHTDQPLMIFLEDAKLNEEPADEQLIRVDGPEVIAPGATSEIAALISGENMRPAPAELRSLSLGIESAEQKAQEMERTECTLIFPTPIPLGRYGATWLQTDQAETTKIMMENVMAEVPKSCGPVRRILAEEVELTGNASAYCRWIPAGLTETQEENIETGSLYLLRISEDQRSAELVSYHKMIRGDDGHFGSRYSGLLLCPEAEPETMVPNFQGWPDAEHVDLILLFGMDGYDEGMGLQASAEDIRLRVDFENNRAEILEVQQGEAEEGIVSVTVLPYSKMIPEDPSVPFSDWRTEIRSHFVSLKGEPMKLMIREAAPEDRLYTLFSVREKDGTEYSLPMTLLNPDQP